MKTPELQRLYLKEIEGYVRYLIDENNVYWYIYDEITDILMLTDRAKTNIYNNWLKTNEKDIIIYKKPLSEETFRSKFITIEGLSRLINRNNKRANNILKAIINNESTESVDYDEFNNNLTELYHKMQNDDYVGITQSIRDIKSSNTFKDILCKYDINYKRENEDLIDEFRNYIYDDYYDDIEIDVKLTKRKDNELDEEKEIKYKRNKDKKSTCPSWLKEIVK